MTTFEEFKENLKIIDGNEHLAKERLNKSLGLPFVEPTLEQIKAGATPFLLNAHARPQQQATPSRNGLFAQKPALKSEHKKSGPANDSTFKPKH